MSGTTFLAPRKRGREDPLLERYPRSASRSAPEASQMSDDRERRQLAAEGLRVIAARASRPRPVLRSDEPRERRPVVERSNGCQTPTADDGDAAPLRLDPTPRLAVIGGCGELLLARANPQRKRALPRLGQQLVGLETPVDLGGETEAVEPTRREHDSIERPVDSLAKPCVDVAAQRF